VEKHSIVSWNWAYFRQAIAQSRDRKLSRNQMPYFLTKSFEANLMRPKSQAEVELAERDRLDVPHTL